MASVRLLVGLCSVLLILAVGAIAYYVTPATRTPSPPGPSTAEATTQSTSQDESSPLNEAWVLQPIAGEPVWPSPDDLEAVKIAGHAPFPGGYQVDARRADGSRDTCVVVRGMVLLTRGLIELFCCGEGGKEHESVLRLECDIQSLDHALVLSGLKRGAIPSRLGERTADEGSRVVALVQWKKDGRTLTYRAEDLIISSKTDRPMPRVGFTYVGQWAEVPDPVAAGKRTFRVLACTGTRSLMTTYRDPSALLDNPLKEGEDDTLFAANTMLLPEPGTPVVMILRPPTEADAKEIVAAEKEWAK